MSRPADGRAGDARLDARGTRAWSLGRGRVDRARWIERQVVGHERADEQVRERSARMMPSMSQARETLAPRRERDAVGRGADVVHPLRVGRGLLVVALRRLLLAAASGTGSANRCPAASASWASARRCGRGPAPACGSAAAGRWCSATRSATSSGRCGWSTTRRPSSGACRRCWGRRTTRRAAGSCPNCATTAIDRGPGVPGPRSTGRWSPRRRPQRLPRLSCSRSIASKSALKLPLPKPSEPCRSMSSKKTVGRSPSGLVKICSR